MIKRTLKRERENYHNVDIIYRKCYNMIKRIIKKIKRGAL